MQNLKTEVKFVSQQSSNESLEAYGKRVADTVNAMAGHAQQAGHPIAFPMMKNGLIVTMIQAVRDINS